MKQTAVEWLIEQLEWDDSKIARVIGLKKYNQVVSQAKEMEKQQIIDAWEMGYIDGGNHKKVTAEMYFAETYGSKLSDEHIEHNLDEIPTPSQTEISDEEIENAAKEYVLYNDQKRAWIIEGMKLYREQLKNKL